MRFEKLNELCLVLKSKTVTLGSTCAIPISTDGKTGNPGHEAVPKSPDADGGEETQAYPVYGARFEDAQVLEEE